MKKPLTCTYPMTACNSDRAHGRGCPMRKSVKRKQTAQEVLIRQGMDAWHNRMSEQMSKAVAGACEDAMIHGTGGVFFFNTEHGFEVKHIPFEVWMKP